MISYASLENPLSIPETIIMWVSIIGLAITIFSSIAVIAYRMGKLEERLNSVKAESVNFVRKDVMEQILTQLSDIKKSIQSLSNKVN